MGSTTRWLASLAVIGLASCAGLSGPVGPETKAALAPPGKLRVAFISPAFVYSVKDPVTGELKGIGLRAESQKPSVRDGVMRSLRAFMLVPFCLAGCGAMQPTTTAPEPSIARSWVKALNECQIDALVALYHGEALFWATTARALATKPEDVRRYYDAACKSMKASNFKLEVASESVKLYGDAAVSAGQTTATFTNRQGQPQTASFRFSLSARKVEGQWLIVEQHVSAMPASPGQ